MRLTGVPGNGCSTGGYGGISSSKGQRARAATAWSSAIPSRSRSIPAHATMIALSVHNAMGGATRAKPWASAARSSRWRRYWFAATPPATTSAWAGRLLGAQQAHRAGRPVDQHVANSRLEARRTGRPWSAASPARRTQLQDLVAHRGLEAREREVAGLGALQRTRQVEPVGVAVASQALDGRAARIAQAQHLRDLVEGLAHARRRWWSRAAGSGPRPRRRRAGNARRRPAATGRGSPAPPRTARSAHALPDD